MFWRFGLTIIVAIGVSAPLHAQTYPSKPIHVVVPVPAGALTDVLARKIASVASAKMGQPWIMENKPGANFMPAAEQCRRSAPDGYTLCVFTTSTLTFNPVLIENLPYDPERDFAPIGLIASSSNVVLVNPSVPVHSIGELIALGKQQDGKLTFASTGTGSSVHLAAELFAGMAGVRFNHVPYKGSGPALNDLLGGHVALMFSTMASAAGLVRDGSKVRALAVTGAARSALFPDLPTVAEAGLPGYEAVLHYGIVAPAGTPRPVVEKLNAALNAALGNDEVKKRLAVEGAEALPASPDEYAADIAREETKWSEIIRKAGVKGE